MSEIIRPADLPAAASVGTGEAIPIDSGASVRKATPAQIVAAGFPISSQVEAEAGVNNATAMTPLRVRQAINADTSGSVALARAWAESPTPPSPSDPSSKSSKTWALEAKASAETIKSFGIPVPFSGVTSYGQSDYLLPFDPLDEVYIRVSLGGVPQEPGVGFSLVRIGASTYIRFLAMPFADGVEFWGQLQAPIGASDEDLTLTPAQFGGDIYAMAEAARETGLPARVIGTFHLDRELMLYGPTDFTGSTLVVPQIGITNMVSIHPMPEDVVANDPALLAAFNAITDTLVKGTTFIPSLAPWVGKNVHMSSSFPYTSRGTSATYRHDFCFQVLDERGQIWPPLKYTPRQGVVWTIAETVVVREVAEVKALHVSVEGGSTPNGTVLRIERPNTWENSPTFENKTNIPISTGITIGNVVRTRITAPSIQGMLVDATNYGINISGSGVLIEDPMIYDCRRSIDTHYGHYIRVNGGFLANGAGAHHGHDVLFTNVYIGPSQSQGIPVEWSGADIVCENCDLVSSGVNMMSSRDDAPEIQGKMQLRGGTATFLSNTVSDLNLLCLEGPNYVNYDALRTVELPTLVVVEGVEIKTINQPNFAGIIDIFSIDDNFPRLEGGQDVITNSRVFISDLKMPELSIGRVVLNKRENWIGDGVSIEATGVPRFRGYFAAGSAANTTIARTRVKATATISAAINMAGGALASYEIDAPSFTVTYIGGIGTLLGDEQLWNSNSGLSGRDFSLADDTATSLASENIYSAFRVFQRNAGANAPWCDVIVSGGTVPGVTITGSGGATWGVSTAALTGTTGADGSITISVNGGKIYIENRSGGGSKAFRILKTLW